MPINDVILNRIRKNTYRAFKKLARGRGVSRCQFYPAVSGGTELVKRNLYHDVVEETGPGVIEPIDTYIYIELNPPLKVVKSLGWYKEDESLPIIGYLPYESHWVPEKASIIVVPAIEGYMSGQWVVEKETMFGQGESCLWACNIRPKRI